MHAKHLLSGLPSLGQRTLSTSTLSDAAPLPRRPIPFAPRAPSSRPSPPVGEKVPAGRMRGIRPAWWAREARSSSWVLPLPFALACGLALALAAAAQPVRLGWVNRYSLNPAGTNQPLGLAWTPDGHLVVAGSSASTNGDLDYVVIQYAPGGAQTWLARYDSPTHGADQMRGLAVDTNGHVLVTGTSRTAKFSPGGALLWTAPYAGRSVAADASNVYVTGFSEVDWATAKLSSSNGSNQWTRYYDCIGLEDRSHQVAVDSMGNVYVAGMLTWNHNQTGDYRRLFIRQYTPTGETNWMNTFDPRTARSPVPLARTLLAVDAAHVYMLGAYFDESGYPGLSYYTTSMFDANGNRVGFVELWDAGLDLAEGRGMVADKQGNVYLTGYSSGGNRCCTYKPYTPMTNGMTDWLAYYQGSTAGRNSGNAITLDCSGNVFVAGYSTNAGSGLDMITIKYDSRGKELWVQRYNGPANGDDIATGIVVDAAGNVYVTGYSATTNGGTEFVTLQYTPFQNLERQPGGAVRLQYVTTPGGAYAFEASTNLQTWQPLATNLADLLGLVRFDDTNAPAFPHRFYRGRTVTP